MAVLEFDLSSIETKELVQGYRKVARAVIRPRPEPVQDALDTISAELSRRNYILCDCESGNRRTEAYDDNHNFIFWACDKCAMSKYRKHMRG